MNTTYKKLGEKIRIYRKSKHLSTAELAKILGVSSGFLNNLENGKTDTFNLNLLTKFMKELDLPIEELFSLAPLPLRQLYCNENNNILIQKLDSESNEKTNLINQHLNSIVRSFLTTISEYGCSETAIKEISKSTTSHLEMMRNLKKI